MGTPDFLTAAYRNRVIAKRPRRGIVKSTTWRFDSLSEKVETVFGPTRQWHMDQNGGPLCEAGIEDGDDPDWYGNVTFSEAAQLARTGWHEGAAMLKEVALQAMPQCGEATSENVMDVAGAYPDPALAAMGDPLNMICPVESDRRTKPCIEILFDGSATRRITGDQKIDHGAAAVTLIDALERAGVRVGVTIGLSAVSRKEMAFYSRTRLKEPDAPLEIESLAFCIAHPAMQRRLNFAVRGMLHGAHAGFPWTMGSSADTPCDEGELYIPSVNRMPTYGPDRGARVRSAIVEMASTLAAQNRRAELPDPVLSDALDAVQSAMLAAGTA